MSGSIKFCIWLLEGDHEHFSNCLRMPHWSSDKFCWECTAGKPVRFVKGSCGCPKRPLKDEATKRMSPHPVFTIPGSPCP